MNKTPTITFSKEQYLTLMKLAYLGNWLANAHRLPDEQIKEYDDLDMFITAHAKAYGLGEFVDDTCPEEGMYYTNRKFEESLGLHEVIGEYDRASFWDEATDCFALRDLLRTYDVEKLKQMDGIEILAIRHAFEEKYDNEFTEHGIERLEIVGPPKAV